MNFLKRGGFLGVPKSWNKIIIWVGVLILGVGFILYQQIILSLVVLGLGILFTIINKDFTEEETKETYRIFLKGEAPKKKKKVAKDKSTFSKVMAYAVLLLGIFLIIHNIMWTPPIGSELVFG